MKVLVVMRLCWPESQSVFKQCPLLSKQHCVQAVVTEKLIAGILNVLQTKDTQTNGRTELELPNISFYCILNCVLYQNEPSIMYKPITFYLLLFINIICQPITVTMSTLL